MAISKDVTISEIAARANVSIATVSRVINQAGNTKAETKQKSSSGNGRIRTESQYLLWY